MNVIMHYPKSEEGMKALREKLTGIHIEAVNHHLQKVACPKELKLRLISEAQKELKRNINV